MPGDTRPKQFVRLWFAMTDDEVGELIAARLKYRSGLDHRSTAKAEGENTVKTSIARDPQPEHVPHDPQP